MRLPPTLINLALFFLFAATQLPASDPSLPSPPTSNQPPPAATSPATNTPDALLQHVIALGNQPADTSYDTNQTEKILQKVAALGGKIKQDNRWIVLRVLNIKENDLILGLSAFVKYSRGKYPTSLLGKTMSDELIKLTNRSAAAGGTRETQDRFKKEFVNALCASGFYEKLIRDKCDPKYYGDKLTVFDTGRVLVRWKLKPDKYRVIFTDLHAEDLTAQRLAELENAQKHLTAPSTNQPPAISEPQFKK